MPRSTCSASKVPKPRSPKIKPSNPIPRPANCFMLYRSDKCKEFAKYSNYSKMCQQDLSRRIADLWKDESEEVKAHYAALAKQKAQEHKHAYPDYKYKPMHRKSKREATDETGTLTSVSQSSKMKMSKAAASTDVSFTQGTINQSLSPYPEVEDLYGQFYDPNTVSFDYPDLLASAPQPSTYASSSFDHSATPTQYYPQFDAQGVPLLTDEQIMSNYLAMFESCPDHTVNGQNPHGLYF